MLRESDERERAEREREVLEREAAEEAARAASEHAAALVDANRQLERAIEGAREARRTRQGVEAADVAWRQAKARLIELETGAPPSWAATVADDRDRGDGDTDDNDEH